jgi:hypothetical protein
VARGITLASLVAFVKGGNNVDDAQDFLAIIRSLTTAMQAMVDAMQYQQNAVQLIEDRVVVLEEHDYNKPELEKLLIDLGFRND